MANRMGWGRKPVIMLRSDAMSIGYRQDIAERLTMEALERDMAFTLAVIPWDDARFSRSRGTAFIRQHGENPNVQVSQHGTYHTCVLAGVPETGSEFGAACGMDESQSVNLMRVGKVAMENALAPRGLVRLPWSQIACGSGAILFELTSFDANFATGEPDPYAIAGYERTLDELKAMAEEEGAVFMTLGQYAAARQMEDTTAPQITITTPEPVDYGHHEVFHVDVDVADELSGVHRVEITLDGKPVSDGDAIDLTTLALGPHTLRVGAEDTAGNVANAEVAFTVVASLDSLAGSVARFAADGDIDSRLEQSLLAKLDAARASAGRRNTVAAANTVTSFINEVNAQRGKFITGDAADLLVADAAVVRDQLRV